MLANKIEEKTLSYTIFRARSVKSRTRSVHDADRARVCHGCSAKTHDVVIVISLAIRELCFIDCAILIISSATFSCML